MEVRYKIELFNAFIQSLTFNIAQFKTTPNICVNGKAYIRNIGE